MTIIYSYRNTMRNAKPVPDDFNPPPPPVVKAGDARRRLIDISNRWNEEMRRRRETLLTWRNQGEDETYLKYAEWIIQHVEAKHRMPTGAIMSRGRAKPIIAARREAIRLIHTHCRKAGKPLNYSDTGRIMDLDHTSVRSALGLK